MSAWSKKTVPELREELKKRGQETTGLKSELVARLEALGSKAAAAAPAEAEEAEEEEEEEAAPRKRTRGAAKTPAKAKATKKQKAEKGKEPAEEEEEEEEEAPAATAAETHKKAGEALRAAAEAEKAKGKKPGLIKVDDIVPNPAAYKVHEDYDCMLNQTNVGQNNNKFYRIQLLVSGSSFYLLTHWGRVGERGQFKNQPVGTAAASAISKFEAQFKSKTNNQWRNRDNFKAVLNKYTLIEMSYDDDVPAGGAVVSLPAEGPAAKPKKIRACTLHARTKEFIDLIFSHDMFKQALATMKIDTNKMPLGKISKSQIAKGYEILDELLAEIKGPNRSGPISTLTSQFYTAIPHSFGRAVPPVIRTEEEVKAKIDLLGVLGDIEIAQGLIKGSDDKQANLEEIDHPSDANYKILKTDLLYLDPSKPEFQDELSYIEKYTVNTQGYRKCKIIDVFRVTRHSEPARFEDNHKHIKERKLLWHGTKVPVIVAILSNGLRIMPHAGGRVGCGLYFASENGKSSAYVGTADKNIGVMFLNEVALGKEKHITADDCSLKAAPPGFDSVVAQGRTEPDPKDDISRVFDGHEVVIPQGKPVARPQYNNSSFSQTEYLVYKESQVRIRYLLKMQF